MATYIECILDGQQDADMPETVVLAVGSVESMRQVYTDEGMWTHTTNRTSSGDIWRVAHILDEIETAMQADKFTARAEA